MPAGVGLLISGACVWLALVLAGPLLLPVGVAAWWLQANVAEMAWVDWWAACLMFASMPVLLTLIPPVERALLCRPLLARAALPSELGRLDWARLCEEAGRSPRTVLLVAPRLGPCAGAAGLRVVVIGAELVTLPAGQAVPLLRHALQTGRIGQPLGSLVIWWLRAPVAGLQTTAAKVLAVSRLVRPRSLVARLVLLALCLTACFCYLAAAATVWSLDLLRSGCDRTLLCLARRVLSDEDRDALIDAASVQAVGRWRTGTKSPAVLKR